MTETTKQFLNLILEEDRKDIYTEVSGEVFFQNLKLEESIDAQGATKIISKTSGLIWVLYGNRHVLQSSSKLDIKVKIPVLFCNVINFKPV